MRICFYAPFKPLDHPDPSGDQVIGKGIYDYLTRRGHHLWTASTLRARWIYLKPWLWLQWVRDRRRIFRRLLKTAPDLWLTYHSYYKAPDVLGPWVAPPAKIPYVIFQGIYATKTRRRMKTWPGYILNTRALQAARHVLTNKRVDLENLKRLIPEKRLTYVPPGIYPEDFCFDAGARDELRDKWHVGTDPVILAAAMFRPDVKTQGLLWLIRSCGVLVKRGATFFLVIAGDGKEKQRLVSQAERHLPGRVRFVGKIPRNEMSRFYSAGDIFAFPGIRESLGMVYLEAQSCGLPVVAFDNGGIPEVVETGKTGFLVPSYSVDAYVRALEQLLSRKNLRREMGRAATEYVRRCHDLSRNYLKLEQILKDVVHGG